MALYVVSVVLAHGAITMEEGKNNRAKGHPQLQKGKREFCKATTKGVDGMAGARAEGRRSAERRGREKRAGTAVGELRPRDWSEPLARPGRNRQPNARRRKEFKYTTKLLREARSAGCDSDRVRTEVAEGEAKGKRRGGEGRDSG